MTQRELTGVMREMGVGAGEAVVRLIETDNQGAILRFRSEEDLIRILGHWVCELKVMTWQEAVRKMTLLPATTYWNGRSWRDCAGYGR